MATALNSCVSVEIVPLVNCLQLKCTFYPSVKIIESNASILSITTMCSLFHNYKFGKIFSNFY